MNRITCVSTRSLWILLCAAGITSIAGPDNAAANAPSEQPAQVKPEQPPADTRITVVGHGSIVKQPTRATMSFSVEHTAPTSQEAMSGANAGMERVTGAIKKLNVQGTSLQTQAVNLRPLHEAVDGRESESGKVVGYRGFSTLRVCIDDISQVGAVIDAAVSAGCNDFGGVDFGLQNEKATRDEAAAAAARDARHRADLLAEALHLRITGIEAVDSQNRSWRGKQSLFAASMTASSPTPIEANEVVTDEDVTVTFRAQPLQK